MNTPTDDRSGDPAPDDGQSFYAKHAKVYPREVKGRFDRLRRTAVFALLGLFYLIPWFTWDGRQAVLFDLPARKFWIFGLVLWPQDFI
ncbi:MAG: cytochrome c oxidase accessory protein CcoG, partial [Proteobacteria bacterium]|nr:cytochrome c oxidase accessory protein CcoG [Pseudomonadota bacterium]